MLPDIFPKMLESIEKCMKVNENTGFLKAPTKRNRD